MTIKNWNESLFKLKAVNSFKKMLPIRDKFTL